LFCAAQKINVERARKEHEDLVETLRRIGLDVIELPSDEKHPDGLFVDDVAIVIHGTALMCNPPTFKDRPSRQGEVMSSLLIHGCQGLEIKMHVVFSFLSSLYSFYLLPIFRPPGTIVLEGFMFYCSFLFFFSFFST